MIYFSKQFMWMRFINEIFSAVVIIKQLFSFKFHYSRSVKENSSKNFQNLVPTYFGCVSSVRTMQYNNNVFVKLVIYIIKCVTVKYFRNYFFITDV